MTDRLASYPKVWTLGHKYLADLFEGPVVVQEKVDGSQFSFGVVGGELHARSRGAVIDVNAPDKLFAGAVATARAAFERGYLVHGYTYRGEAMMGARHNTLVYERAPLGNFVLFDVDRGIEDRLDDRAALEDEARIIGCEVVPELYRGEGEGVTLERLRAFTEQPSFLGGRMEGVVIKNYSRFGIDGKMLMGKYTTDAFKEAHAANPDWKPKSREDVLAQIRKRYAHPRRWEKAVERLRDAGTLLGAPQDIGPLMKEVQQDVEQECRDEIAQQLWDYYRWQILKGVTTGLVEWYKERLAAEQFAA